MICTIKEDGAVAKDDEGARRYYDARNDGRLGLE